MLREGYASQYGCPSVIIDDVDNDEDRVIEFARSIRATVYDEGTEDYVVDFRISPGKVGFNRHVGPEIYTEESLRSSIRDFRRLASMPTS